MAVNVGDRVGAIMDITDGKARLFGYGIYRGYQTPPVFGVPNPCIELDNGAFVFGYQCWWGSEAGVKNRVASCDVEIVPVPAANAGFTMPQKPEGGGYVPPEGIKVEKL